MSALSPSSYQLQSSKLWSLPACACETWPVGQGARMIDLDAKRIDHAINATDRNAEPRHRKKSTKIETRRAGESDTRRSGSHSSVWSHQFTSCLPL